MKNFKKLMLLFCAICILSNVIKAQYLNFYQTYPVINLHQLTCIIQLKDSGYIAAGNFSWHYPYLIRTDKFGNLLWNKSFSNLQNGIYGLANLNDTSFIASSGFKVANGLDITVVVFNLDGDTLHRKEYGYTNGGMGYRINRCIDGGFILNNGDQWNYDILKIDSNLNVEWNNFSFMGIACNRIKEDKFGGYVAVGGGTWGNQPFEVTRFDSNGNKIWKFHYGDLNPNYFGQSFFATDVEFTSDSNYLVSTDGWEWQLMKINRITGDTMWTKNFKDVQGGLKHIDKIIKIGFKRYALLRRGDCFIINESGQKLKTLINFYSATNGGSFNDFIKTTDGGFAFCGSGNLWNPPNMTLALLKIDSGGYFVNTTINELNYFNENVFIYPNPSSDYFFFDMPFKEPVYNFLLYDLQGMVLNKSELTDANIDNGIKVSHLPNGLYIAELRNAKGDKVVRQKLVVQH